MAETRCPACGEPLFGGCCWTPVSREAGATRRRALRALRPGVAPDLAAGSSSPSSRLRAPLRGDARAAGPPNRASVQASLGARTGRRWSQSPALCHPRSLLALAAAAGLEITSSAAPAGGRGQRWMWQTLVNGAHAAAELLPRVARRHAAPGGAVAAGRVRDRRGRHRARGAAGRAALRCRWSWSRPRRPRRRARGRGQAERRLESLPAPEPLGERQRQLAGRVLAGERAGAVQQARDDHALAASRRP